MPKVSVILSSYNHASYVAEAIESVLNQTFRDFELLIFDDGSTDGSADIIRSFRDERIRTFLYEENRGPFEASKEAASEVRGEYLAIHHSDDVWEPEKLSQQVRFLDEHPEYVACFTRVQFIDENGQKYEPPEGNIYHGVFDQQNRSREEWLHDLFFRGNCFCHPSILARSKFYAEYGAHSVTGFYQLPDYFAWIRFAMHGEIYVLQEKLTRFRLRKYVQDNMSADTEESEKRGNFELYQGLKLYRTIRDQKFFLAVFPEAKEYQKAGVMNVDFALAQVLLKSGDPARRLLALEILFELLNHPETEKQVEKLYGYTGWNFIQETASGNIFTSPANRRTLQTSLFFDTGHGFNENQKLSQSVRLRGDRSFVVKFHVPIVGDIQGLRFDPTENEAIVMHIDSILVDGKKVLARPQQPCQKDAAGDIFLSEDPSYLLEWKGSGGVEVFIKGTLPLHQSALQVLQQEKQKERRRYQEELRQYQEDQKKQLEEKTNLEAILHAKEATLQEIYSSRGYRLVQMYYHARDKILPRGSRRRLMVKTFVWCILHIREMLSLMNRENANKVWAALRNGGLHQVLSRIDRKLHSSAVMELSAERTFGNNWLIATEPPIWPDGMAIDILVPIYNAYEFTRKCIETVYDNTEMPYNLYLIDDCSPDRRIAELMEELQKKKKPASMLELHIMRNEENLGFIGSVNRGLEHSKNHVVLLNTDTEVPPNWLSRLVAPMIKDDKIASVTPFSNSAEICSFPQFCQNNELPRGMTVSDMDSIFARYGAKDTTEIPTGVGFCMLLNRICIEKWGKLDPIYGKGYGEENDWCCRMAAHGYRSVHVRNLFVYHKHGASFAEMKNKSKAQRIQENLAKLAMRYPDYQERVHTYIARDPVAANRNFLWHCVQAENKKDTKGVIFLNHSMGGGATVYQNRMIEECKKKWRVYGMEPLADGVTLLVKGYNGTEAEKISEFSLKEMDATQFSSLLEALHIDWIFVNQLLTYPMPDILDWIMETGIEYTFFGHDFYAICPHYQLLNFKMKYCGPESDIQKCENCLNRSDTLSKHADIRDWRDKFENFLKHSKEVIVPSEDTAKIFQQFYSAPVTVREHVINENLRYTYRDEFALSNVLSIAVIGAIGDEKGAKILYAVADELEKRKLSVRIVVIGITNLHNEFYLSKGGKFEVTGPYDNKMISVLLEKYRIGAVLIPSIWPETYSYTTTEAMHSGYPVIVFPLGAPAERIRRIGGGWILEEISAEAVLKKLDELYNHRDEIVEQAHVLKKVQKV